MYCKNCGSDAGKPARYCPECGVEMESNRTQESRIVESRHSSENLNSLVSTKFDQLFRRMDRLTEELSDVKRQLQEVSVPKPPTIMQEIHHIAYLPARERLNALQTHVLDITEMDDSRRRRVIADLGAAIDSLGPNMRSEVIHDLSACLTTLPPHKRDLVSLPQVTISQSEKPAGYAQLYMQQTTPTPQQTPPYYQQPTQQPTQQSRSSKTRKAIGISVTLFIGGLLIFLWQFLGRILGRPVYEKVQVLSMVVDKVGVDPVPLGIGLLTLILVMVILLRKSRPR